MTLDYLKADKFLEVLSFTYTKMTEFRESLSTIIGNPPVKLEFKITLTDQNFEIEILQNGTGSVKIEDNT